MDAYLMPSVYALIYNSFYQVQLLDLLLGINASRIGFLHHLVSFSEHEIWPSLQVPNLIIEILTS